MGEYDIRIFTGVLCVDFISGCRILNAEFIKYNNVLRVLVTVCVCIKFAMKMYERIIIYRETLKKLTFICSELARRIKKID